MIKKLCPVQLVRVFPALILKTTKHLKLGEIQKSPDPELEQGEGKRGQEALRVNDGRGDQGRLPGGSGGGSQM